jgi:hypothetical protein
VPDRTGSFSIHKAEIASLNNRHHQPTTLSIGNRSTCSWIIHHVSGKMGLRQKFAHLGDIGSDNHELRHDPQYPPDLHGILIAAHLSEISLAHNPQAKG